VQDSVDVPEPPETLVEDKLQDRLVELLVTARVTVPEKPFTGDTVMDEVPAAPTLTLTLVGLAAIAKSCEWYVTVAECESVLLVPVTVAR
jgi:hypothetical protein